MNEPIDNPPAFPSGEVVNANGKTVWHAAPGMSLRDYFAATALTGQLTCMGNQAEPEKRSTEAYRFADAMLKARVVKCDSNEQVERKLDLAIGRAIQDTKAVEESK